MKKKIIITGGLGYIGTELCKLYLGKKSGYAEVKLKDIRKKYIQRTYTHQIVPE